MNTNIFRVIFSKAFGQWVVVGENAKSNGKSKALSISHSKSRSVKPAWTKLSIAIALGLGMFNVAAQQIKVDANAPQKPIIGVSASNNVPVINIVPPKDFPGVSHNKFNDFNVPTQGLIFNNTSQSSNSTLGGAVSGNPQLGNQTAQTIVSEVIGPNSTTIGGSIEVTGPRANLIIANMRGLNVNGLNAPVKFINTSDVSLVQGWASKIGVYDGRRYSSYDMTSANITVSGKGIDGFDALKLIAREVKVNAPITGNFYSSNLQVLTGMNDVDTQTMTVYGTENLDPSRNPTYSLDVSELGSMHAGTMSIKSTAEGIGVRNKGVIGLRQWSTGDININAKGDLTNSGTILSTKPFGLDSDTSAYGDLYINAYNVWNDKNGSIKARKNYIDLSRSLFNSGTISADRELGLYSTYGNILNDGTISQLSAAKDSDLLSISGQELFNQNGGKITAKNLSVETIGDISNKVASTTQNSSIKADNMFLNAGRDINNTGSDIVGGFTSLNAGRDINNISMFSVSQTGDINSESRGVSTYETKITKPANIESLKGDFWEGGATLEMSASGDINMESSSFKSAGSTNLYANNINLKSITSGKSYQSITDDENKFKEASQIQTSSIIDSRNNNYIHANQNINATAGQIIGGIGGNQLTAGGDISLLSGKAMRYTYKTTSDVRRNALGIETGKNYTMDTEHNEEAIGTQVIGSSVSIIAGGNINVDGGNVFGQNGVDITSTKGNINIQGAQTKQNLANQYIKTSYFDFSLNPLTWIGFGSSKLTEQYKQYKTAYSDSNVTAMGGDVNVLSIAGGTQIAKTNVNSLAGDINVSGKQVNIMDTNENVWTQYSKRYDFNGLKLTYNSGLIKDLKLLKALYDQSKGPKSDASATALGLSGALASYNAYKTVTDPSTWKEYTVGSSASVMLGRDSQFTQTTAQQSTSRESNVLAGGKVNLLATGTSAETKRGLTIQGSSVAGTQGTNLESRENINVLAGRSVANTQTTTENTNAAVGLGLSGTVGSQGYTFGVTANGSYNNNGGLTSTSEVINNEAYVGDRLSTTSIKSGQDTTIYGSQVFGQRVNADVGKNFSIKSAQDQYNYNSQTGGYGVNVAIPIWGAGYNLGVSLDKTQIGSNYKSVVEQAGVFSGSGGHTLKVGNNAYLKSAAIVSTAGAPKQTLLVNNIFQVDDGLTNSAAYSANSTSLSVGIGTNADGTLAGFHGLTANAPVALHASDSVNGTAKTFLSGNVNANVADLRGSINALTDFNVYANTITVGGLAVPDSGISAIGTISLTSDNGIYMTNTSLRSRQGVQFSGSGAIKTSNAKFETLSPNFNIDTSISQPLQQIFDLKKIENGFAIAGTLSQNFSGFITIKNKEIDTAGSVLARDKNGNYVRAADGKYLSIKEASALKPSDTGYGLVSGADFDKYKTLQGQWGNGGYGKILLTSLMGATNANVTAGANQFLQNAAINVVRQYTATEIKVIADGFRPSGATTDDALAGTIRAALHAISSCGSSLASGGQMSGCTTAAGSAAATSALNSLLKIDPNTMTEAQKQNYSNLIQTLVTGVTLGVNPNSTTTAQIASQIEAENNTLLDFQMEFLDRRTQACSSGFNADCKDRLNNDRIVYGYNGLKTYLALAEGLYTDCHNKSPDFAPFCSEDKAQAYKTLNYLIKEEKAGSISNNLASRYYDFLSEWMSAAGVEIFTNRIPTVSVTTKNGVQVRSILSNSQFRHVFGSNAYEKERKIRNLSYFLKPYEPQKVFNAILRGEATFLGFKSDGSPVYRYSAVLAKYSFGANSTLDTNVFSIKGTSSPSILPEAPNPTLLTQ